MADTCRDMYSIRVQIGSALVGRLRAQHGNKDGVSKDGTYRRYDNPHWAEVEKLLEAACLKIFQAEEIIRNHKLEPT